MEQIVLQREAGGPMKIVMTTDFGEGCTLVMTKLIPLTPELGQMQVMQLQVDMLQEAIKRLQFKLDQGRQMDRAAGPQP